MNPETNRFEPLLMSVEGSLLRPDGTPVPPHWAVFSIDERVIIKNHIFKVAYIGETSILFEPVSPADVLPGDLPCVEYVRGKSTALSDCEGDGHYQCAGCLNHKEVQK